MLLKNVKVLRPKTTKIQKRNGIGYVYQVIGKSYKRDKKYTVENRKLIGKMIDEEWMVPNEYFEQYYPDVCVEQETPEFSDTLKDNLKFFLNKIGWDEDVDCFSIVPVKGKKIVAKVWGRPTNASIGIYKLQGTPRLLDFLYSAGLGSRRSEGHGKWEIVW